MNTPDVPEIRCPACNSAWYRTLATKPQPNGTERKRLRCEHCGRTWNATVDTEKSA